MVSAKSEKSPGTEISVPSTSKLLGRALVLACPLCGGRPVIDKWFGMHDRCAHCNLRFERVVGHWFGSLTLNTIVTFGALLVLIMGLFLASWPDRPPGNLMFLAVATCIVVPAIFTPFSRTLWLAADLKMRPLEPGEARMPGGTATDHAGDGGAPASERGHNL